MKREMTDKQVAYAKLLQKKLMELNPLDTESTSLIAMDISNNTESTIIDKLQNAIMYEEHLTDLAFGGEFMQE